MPNLRFGLFLPAHMVSECRYFPRCLHIGSEPYFNSENNICNIMLISTACGSHHDRSACKIDIDMILYTVFKMFVNLKTGCQTIWRQHREEGCQNTALTWLLLNPHTRQTL